MTHYTRSQWGARAPRAGNPVTNGPKGVAFHWNGPAMRINVTGSCRCATNVRSIQAFHMDGRGWSDIAYDVIACPHGNTFQGRLGTRNGTGANGTNAANRDYMAVMALVGEGEPVGDDLKRAMLAGRALCRKAGAGSAITPHSQHQSTTCPGPTIRAWISEGAPAPGEPGPAIPPKEAPTMLTQSLKRGDTGPEVELLQHMLNGLRKAGLTADGSFGPATEAAVIAAHKAWGIAAPHNVVGPGFRTRINAEWAKHNAPAPAPKPDPKPPANPYAGLTDRALLERIAKKIGA